MTKESYLILVKMHVEQTISHYIKLDVFGLQVDCEIGKFYVQEIHEFEAIYRTLSPYFIYFQILKNHDSPKLSRL